MYAIARTGFSPVKTLYTDTDINEYFRALTGFQPRQFQAETIRKILNHQDVLLRAPAGSGKTETSRPFSLLCLGNGFIWRAIWKFTGEQILDRPNWQNCSLQSTILASGAVFFSICPIELKSLPNPCSSRI